MSEALARRADALQVDVPRAVWRRSKRPARGTFFRFTFALTFVLLGVGIPWPEAKLALVALGVAAFVALPALIDARLERIEREELLGADRAKASALLRGLEQRRLVALFAPHAWVSLQKGRLHLRLGDGRGAARAFAEAARLSGDPEQPALMSAQAHALTISGDRRDARALLGKLENEGTLGPHDHLNLGINLIEGGRAKQALEHLETAASVLVEHPRVAAARSLALAKADRLEEALEAYTQAEGLDGLEDDALAPDLLKRARKALRSTDAGKAKTTRVGEGEAAAPTRAKKKKGKRHKKDKRKERRERRKAGKGKPERVETKTAPAKKATSEKPPAPERPAVPEKKAMPEKPAAREKRAAPVQNVTPEKKTEPDKKPMPENRGAPRVSLEGDKPVFRPPAVPPPPVLQGPPKRAGAPVPPSLGGAQKIGGRPPPSSKPAPDDGWGDLFGEEDDGSTTPSGTGTK